MRAAFAPSTFRVTRSGSVASPSTASVTAPGKCPSKCGKSDAQKRTSSPIVSTSGGSDRSSPSTETKHCRARISLGGVRMSV